ncbi:MAG: hypothetical protein HY875_01495 [Chloroflexi bacterium]|nr:hypothetical protein [Chloroflexota bacterium]
MTRLERRHRELRAHSEAYTEARSSTGGSRLLLTAAVAVLTLLLIGAVSARQVADPGEARHVIAAGIESTTEVDVYLAENIEAIRSLAEASKDDAIPLPGFPVAVYLTRQEATTLAPAALREIILDRSAAAVYDHGLDAFDQTGKQSVDLLSTEGAIDFMLARIDRGAHDRAEPVAVVLTVLFAAAACGVVLLSEGWARMRNTGIAVALGAFVAFAASGLLYLSAGSIGGDPYASDLGDLLRAIVVVPLRNSIIVLLAGVAIVVAATVLSRLEQRMTPPEPDLFPVGPDGLPFAANDEWDAGSDQ